MLTPELPPASPSDRADLPTLPSQSFQSPGQLSPLLAWALADTSPCARPPGQYRATPGSHCCGGPLESSSIGHPVACLLGTSCCLIVGGGVGLPQLERAASPARSPELLAAPDAAGLPRWLFRPSPWLGALAGPWGGPSRAAALSSLRGSTGRRCRFKLFPYWTLTLRPGLRFISREPRLHRCDRPALLQEPGQGLGDPALQELAWPGRGRLAGGGAFCHGALPSQGLSERPGSSPRRNPRAHGVRARPALGQCFLSCDFPASCVRTTWFLPRPAWRFSTRHALVGPGDDVGHPPGAVLLAG